MISLFRALKADFQKLKHTPMFWIHLIIPVIGALGLLFYLSSHDSVEKLAKEAAHFEMLAIMFPLLIGLICGMVASQEEQAGGFQVLLSSTRLRSTTYLSKLLMLIFMGMFSLALTLSIMFFGFKFILDAPNISHLLYLKVFGWLIFSNVFIYILHLFISLQFGRGASTLLGIAGTLIAALMATGLGNRCWTYTPWAWGLRFSELTVLMNTMSMSKELSTLMQYSMNKAMWIMTSATLSTLMLSLFWFKFWEGQKTYE